MEERNTLFKTHEYVKPIARRAKQMLQNQLQKVKDNYTKFKLRLKREDEPEKL